MNKALTEYTPKARTLNLRSLTCFQVFSLASTRLCRGEACLARRLMTCIFALCAIFSWYDVNKALTEYTPKAYLTGEARLAHHVMPRRKIIAMRIEPRPMAVVSLISPMWNFGRKPIKKRALPVVFMMSCYNRNAIRKCALRILRARRASPLQETSYWVVSEKVCKL